MRFLAPTEEPESTNEYFHWCRSVTVGVFTALIVGLLLDLLGAGIGLSLFSPTKGALYLLSIGMVVWLLFVSVASMYAGGWVAGYFSEARSSKTGAFYGMMVSSVSIIILAALTFSALGTVVSSSLTGLQYAVSSLHSTLTEGASAVGKLSKGISKISPALSEKIKRTVPDLQPVIDEINQKVVEFLPPQDETREGADKDKLEKRITHYLRTTGNAGNEKARGELMDALAETSGKPRAEINQKVDEWQKLYLETKEKARQATVELSKDIAKTVSQLATLNFFILLSGIIAAIVGGIHGIKQEIKGRKP